MRASRTSGCWLAYILCLAFALVPSLPIAAAPSVAALPTLAIDEGGVFTPLLLDTYVTDPEFTDAELVWRVVESENLLVSVVDGTAYFAAPHTDWYGSDTVLLEACNPAGECTTCEIELEVVPINDPPNLSLPAQIATELGQPFSPFMLEDFVTDIDDTAASLQWSVDGELNLKTEIRDGVLSIQSPDTEWVGAEDLTISVCDPSGACATGITQFVVADEDALTIRLINNAGFQLRWGDFSVMIDAVYRDPAYRFPEILSAKPPFDADVLLFTHSHPDHFDPDIVAQYMRASPETLLIAPIDAIDRVLQLDPTLEDRATGIELERDSSLSLERHGIPITLYDIPHGGTPNISYLVKLGEHTIFHSGDVVWSRDGLRRLFEIYGLADEDVSVALLVPWFFSSDESRELMRTNVNADIYIPIHVKPGSFSYYHGLAAEANDILVIDELLESWVIPGE
ncbi:MBL fold metallo-hydrolase [Candidatus Bipolaricaulota bacterium]